MRSIARILLITATMLGLSHAAPLFAGTIQYTYDAAGRLTHAKYANGATIEYTYDAAGNLLTREVTSATKADDPALASETRQSEAATSRETDRR